MRKAIFVLLLVEFASAQRQKQRPRFKDFAVANVYSGPPAAPKINHEWRTFRTMIRQGAKARVELAGHYTVPSWGCGAGCSAFVIIDSVTGTIYNGFSVLELPGLWVEKHAVLPRMEFYPRSRLFKVNGCIDERNCGFYDYIMVEGKGLKLIRKELLSEEFQ
jgi:hypothetical protein